MMSVTKLWRRYPEGPIELGGAKPRAGITCEARKHPTILWAVDGTIGTLVTEVDHWQSFSPQHLSHISSSPETRI